MLSGVDAEQAVIEARRTGDREATVRALVAHADWSIQRGRLEAACSDLDEAAGLNREAGRAQEEARCMHLAATVCRIAGRLDEAEHRARRAASLAAAETPERVAARTELGEIAMTRRSGPAAAAAFAEALQEGSALTPASRGALLRRRAEALMLAGDALGAAEELRRAGTVLAEADEAPAARRAGVEEAAAWHAAGQAERAQRACEETRPLAEAAGDAHVLADLELMAATLALGRNDPETAYLAAWRGREHALQAVAPASYIAAALAISSIAERLGERVAAYEALAVGWATLGDLLGADAARATFAPRLVALRDRWGSAEFENAKAAYEAARRAARNDTDRPPR
jgi:tetratricopeptide (TPR) repeat protein